MNLTQKLKLADARDLLALFDQFTDLTHRHGITLRRLPQGTSLRYLETIGHVQIQRSYRNLFDFYVVLSELERANIDLRNNRSMIWNALKHLKLRGHAELLSTVTDDDIIEIYDTAGVQIFRNLKFFEYCTYTVEHVFTRSFMDLYERPNAVNFAIIKQGIATFLGINRTHFFHQVPTHVLREKSSVERVARHCDMRVKSPLFESKSDSFFPTAILTTLRMSSFNLA